jgi:hypothetical protein
MLAALEQGVKNGKWHSLIDKNVKRKGREIISMFPCRNS